MDPEQQFIKWLVVGTAVSFAAYGIHLWWGSLGRQRVGAVPGRIDHLGRYAFRTRVVVKRRIVTADVPEVELWFWGRKKLTFAADEARQLADQLDEAARLASAD